MFIRSDSKLFYAINAKDWHTVAVRYNGAGYRELAKRLGRTPYDISMAQAYSQFKKHNT
jgi:hypothetical protein